MSGGLIGLRCSRVMRVRSMRELNRLLTEGWDCRLLHVESQVSCKILTTENDAIFYTGETGERTMIITFGSELFWNNDEVHVYARKTGTIEPNQRAGE